MYRTSECPKEGSHHDDASERRGLVDAGPDVELDLRGVQLDRGSAGLRQRIQETILQADVLVRTGANGIPLVEIHGAPRTSLTPMHGIPLSFLF